MISHELTLKFYSILRTIPCFFMVESLFWTPFDGKIRLIHGWNQLNPISSEISDGEMPFSILFDGEIPSKKPCHADIGQVPSPRRAWPRTWHPTSVSLARGRWWNDPWEGGPLYHLYLSIDNPIPLVLNTPKWSQLCGNSLLNHSF